MEEGFKWLYKKVIGQRSNKSEACNKKNVYHKIYNKWYSYVSRDKKILPKVDFKWKTYIFLNDFLRWDADCP